NEEVRYFKSIGGQNRIFFVIIRGEPNASDDPARAPSECFPPALRFVVYDHGTVTNTRTEPIAGDLRPGTDGPNTVLLKAVAGILGVGYNAIARRETRRRRVRRWIVAMVLIVAIIAGVWAWDYTRVKVAYFEQIGERWGVPEGLLPLDDKAIHHRDTS